MKNKLIKTTIILVLICKLSVAKQIPANLLLDEAALISSQAMGHDLYANCVQRPPLTPEEVSRCSAVKVSYILLLKKLNTPYPLTVTPDPYSYSPFTPCGFETANLVLFDICL